MRDKEVLIEGSDPLRAGTRVASGLRDLLGHGRAEELGVLLDLVELFRTLEVLADLVDLCNQACLGSCRISLTLNQGRCVVFLTDVH